MLYEANDVRNDGKRMARKMIGLLIVYILPPPVSHNLEDQESPWLYRHTLVRDAWLNRVDSSCIHVYTEHGRGADVSVLPHDAKFKVVRNDPRASWVLHSGPFSIL